MQPDRAALTAPFAEEELRTFEGRGGKTMTFIEDETVMDRLDAAFGVGGWQVLVEAVPLYEGVVKVKLGIRSADSADWTWYEDFGYPNQQGGDVLKEAVSDGIRRCGRYLGIARDLYRKRTYERPQNGHTAPRPPAPVQIPTRPIIAPQRSSTAVPENLDWDSLSPTPPVAVAERPVLSGTVAVTDKPKLSDGENWCPVHGLAWVLKPAGTSKNGAPYDAFYACSSTDRPYCKEKPTKQWVAMRTGVPA